MEDIPAVIRSYIAEEMMFTREDEPLPADRPLLGDIIDSMGLQMLVPFLEDRFGIRIPDVELVPDNFQDIRSISGMVARLRK